MALAAYAAISMAPSAASAAPVITHPTGSVLATGKLVTATNVGAVLLKTPIGNFECSTSRLTGKLTANAAGKGFDIEIEKVAFAGTGATAAGEPAAECTATGSLFPVSVTPEPATNGTPWCLQATTTIDEFTLRGNGCTVASRAIQINLTETFIGTCSYERATSVPGTLRTDISEGEDGTLTIGGQEWKLIAGPVACAASFKLEATYTIETDSTMAEPLYISSK
jgi:hypothetical protein